MQVSWIDPDEIAKLAAQLHGPLQREETASWDVETLPDFSKLFSHGETGSVDPAQLAHALAAPVPEPLDQKGAAPAPEIEHIREKLRAIRNRAQEAGLLPARQMAEPLPESIESVEPADAAPPPASEPASQEIQPPRTPVRIPPVPHPAKEPSADSAGTRLVSSKPLPSLEGSLTRRLQSYMPWAQSMAPCEDILLVDDHGDLLWGGPARADLALSVVLAAGAGLRSGSDALTRSSVFIRSRLGEQQELSVLPCPTRYGMVTLALLNAKCLNNDTAACLREALTLCVDGGTVSPAADSGTELS